MKKILIYTIIIISIGSANAQRKDNNFLRSRTYSHNAYLNALRLGFNYAIEKPNYFAEIGYSGFVANKICFERHYYHFPSLTVLVGYDFDKKTNVIFPKINYDFILFKVLNFNIGAGYYMDGANSSNNSATISPGFGFSHYGFRNLCYRFDYHIGKSNVNYHNIIFYYVFTFGKNL